MATMVQESTPSENTFRVSHRDFTSLAQTVFGKFQPNPALTNALNAAARVQRQTTATTTLHVPQERKFQPAAQR